MSFSSRFVGRMAAGAVAFSVVAANCAPAYSAVCVLTGNVPGQPDSGVSGFVRFTQIKNDGGSRPSVVKLHVKVTGLKANSVHGFHIHGA